MQEKASNSPKRGEFARIDTYLRPLADGLPGALGLADDAGWLDIAADRRLVVTTDAMVEGVHYLPGEPPDRLAQKLLRVNLSDLAAMAAVPLAYVLTLALPAGWSDADMAALAQGLEADQRTYGLALLGGDSVSTAGPAVLSVTAFGTVAPARLLTRSGAAPGDRVCVSGTLGDGALGLVAARDGIAGLDAAAADALAQRYHRPTPRVELGQRLAGIASACADLSDGLVGDLGHICAASGVAARLAAARLPLSAPARAAIACDPALRARAFSGGDDYELVFTVPPERVTAATAVGRLSGVGVTEIGEIRPADGAGPAVIMAEPDGTLLTGLSGWQHV